MKKTLSTLIYLLLFSFLVQAQTVYEWYQDSIVVFQLKPNVKYTIPVQNQYFNIEEIDFLNRMKDEYGIFEGYQFFPDYDDELLRNTYQIKFTQIYEVDALIKQIEQLPFIKYAEKKELHKKFITPNDLGPNPNGNQNNGMWHLWTMQAQQAWDLSTGSSNIVVAVTDDAVKIDHPDLVNKVVPGNDATNQNSNNPMPCGGNDGNHGTHVAGTVGAETNNGIGVASIGWDVSIMPVKIGRCSDGALTGGYEGVAWAANNGADIINMSWGGGGSSNFAQNVVNNATNQGAILVAAAGNDGTTQLFYPAAYNNVIAVASTTITDAKSGFSQYGNWIDIAAPGSAILSTWASTNGYSRIQGTSMASPNVAGLLGLMKSYAPNATNADLINCLLSTADPVTSFQNQMGAGRINAFAAMECAGDFAFTTDAGISQIVVPSGGICGSEFTPQIRLRNFGSDPITNVPITWEWNGTQNTFNWSGNLTTGQTEIITLPTQAGLGGNYTFTATANLSGDQNPSNNSSSNNFTIDPTGQEIEFTLTTDCYGSEITWNIQDENNNTLLSGGPYANIAGGETILDTYCLPVGCYTFNIADSYGDGMFGSQWNGCAVNGNYFATTIDGIPLFEMTAPNADFGNGTSHDFCLIAADIENDAGIAQIINPVGVLCDSEISPQVRIQNYGSNNLTSAIINYSAGGGVQTFTWTGNLTTGQSQVVTLPNIIATGGNVVFNTFTSLPNGEPDDNSANDLSQSNITVYSNGLDLPFTESFESNSFNTNLWTLLNPDNDITWDIVDVDGNNPGNKAARMNFFNYTQASQRDGLISPLLNLSGFSSVDLDFEHAYRRFIVQGSNQPAPTDSLIIYVSSDCGANWQSVFQTGEDGTGSMATNVSSNQDFVPQTTQDWCLEQVLVGGNLVGANCFTVSLDAFIGEQIFVRFEGFNAGTQGNNLYLDNINIMGVPIPFQYDAGITDIVNPSPVCGTSFEPLVEITNFGGETLTSATIEFQLNGGTTETFNWSGNLASGQSELVALPIQTVQNGNNTFLASTNAPNGQADENPANDAQSITINATPLVAPNVNIPTQICANTNETVVATPNSGGNIVWFDDLLESTPIATGNNLSINEVQGNYDYYVQEIIDSTSQNVGPTNFFGGGFFANTDRFLYFDVFDDVILKSVLVNAQNAGNRNIQLRDSNGNILQQTTVNIPAGVSRVTLNFQIDPGSNYQLGLGAGINDLWRSNEAASIQYPYAINGLISIVESDVGVDFNPPEPNNYYYSFYDWEVARPYCESVKTLVNVEVENCGNEPVADFEANQISVCVGETVNFTDLSSETPTSWAWTFNGGTPSTSNIQNPSITYNTAGTYQVSLTVSNSFGSDTETKSSYITVGAPPTVTIDGDNNFCSGGNTILVANTSGANIATYQWKRNGNNVGNNSNTFTATQAGNYTLEVTDVNGCSATSAVFSVSQNTAPTVSIDGDNSFCSGSNTILTANTSGANITTYQWKRNGNNVGNNSNTFTATQAGNYTLEVTDVNGCSATSAVFSVSQNAAPTVSIVGNNVFCSGGNTVLTANTSGANISIYQWRRNGNNVGNNSNTFTANQAGIYTLEITDVNGCSQISNPFTLAENLPLDLEVTTSDAGCGLNNGSASATVNGVTNGYTFEWSTNPTQNGSTISNLSFGSYTVTATENSTGCEVTQNFTIQNADAPEIDSIVVIQPNCVNNLGEATAFVSGGSGSYTYSWGGSLPNLANVSDLTPGTYTLEVEDGQGCFALQSFEVLPVHNISVEASTLVNANCISDSNGSITLDVSGGDGNYTFEWSNNETSQNLSNLSAGNYTVNIEDNSGCEASTTFTIGVDVVLNVALTVLNQTSNAGDATIIAEVSGGNDPYNFSWNDGEFSGDTLENVSAGEYYVTVSDNNGCAVLSDTIMVGTVSIREIDLFERIKLYPNPTSNILNINGEGILGTLLEVEVYNIMGQLILKEKISHAGNIHANINLSGLAVGVYQVRIQSENQQSVWPIVKTD